jgi:hypothetical protein
VGGRHFKANGDKFDDLNTPMGWSANLLWTKPSMNEAIKFMENNLILEL